VTGPPYPRYAAGNAPGGNAIGSFIIGESPIGEIPAFDWWRTVISQYANSPILMQLTENFFQYIDPTSNIVAFFDLVFNVDTAVGYGLDVWGRIVDISRTLFVLNADNYLGFEEAADPLEGSFGQFPFYSGVPLTNNFDLSDDAFRTLIFAKALANISNGSIFAINQLMMNLFKTSGNCYVRDNLDMTISYVFQFILSPVQIAIVSRSGVLPKPAGVSFDIVQGF
jgi:hypothetical protein